MSRMLPDPWIPYAYHIVQGLTDGIMSNPATGSWSAANRAIYVPAIFPCDTTVYAIYTRSNSATGNYDLGLYGPDMNKLISAGSTANAATLLTLSVPSMRVFGGYTYWIGVTYSSGSSFYRSITDSNSQMMAMESAMEESALPLPSTMTPVFNTTTQIPLVGFGVR